MNSEIDGVEKTRVGIGSEINCDIRFRSDRAGDFDVENDFSVVAVRIALWRILRSIHAHRCHCYIAQAELFPVGLEIAFSISAAQFDQGDRLAFAGIRRKIVELCNIGGL